MISLVQEGVIKTPKQIQINIRLKSVASLVKNVKQSVGKTK